MKKALLLAIAFAFLMFGVTNYGTSMVFWPCMIGSLVFNYLALVEGGEE